MVLSAACVKCLSSLRSSFRLLRRLDLNSRVFDDFLNLVLDLGVEGQPHVLAGVHPGAGVEAGVAVEGRADLLQRDAVLGAELQAEALVQRLDDAREWLENRRGRCRRGACSRPGRPSRPAARARCGRGSSAGCGTTPCLDVEELFGSGWRHRVRRRGRATDWSVPPGPQPAPAWRTR